MVIKLVVGNYRDETGVNGSLLVQLAWGNSPPLVMLRSREREKERETGLSIGRWAMEEGLRERNHHWVKGNGHCEL